MSDIHAIFKDDGVSALSAVFEELNAGGFGWCSDPDCGVCEYYIDAAETELEELRQAHDTLRAELTASEMECLRLTIENENLKARN